jgi:PAS domain S-box-containing protein
MMVHASEMAMNMTTDLATVARPAVLIVDDDTEICEALGDLLEKEGYQVHAVARGEEAIQMVRQIRYGAAVLDMQLPDLDGLAVLRIMLQLDAALPVVVLTCNPTLDYTIGTLNHGAFTYLTKPYNDEEMKATLRRAVTMRALAAKAERVENDLRKSEVRFHSVVESAPDAIIVADDHRRIISWNRAAERMFQYSASEVLAQPLTMLMPARYRAGHEKGLERLRSSGQPSLIGKTAELHGLRKDGTEFPLELSLATWKADQGIFYSGIIRDITERKQGQEAVRDSEERFRQLAENIREVFWMSDLEKTRIIYVSPGYQQIWGRSCESLYSAPRSWLEAIHPEDRTRVLSAALTKQVAGEYNEEYRIVRPDGSIRWIHDRAFPVRDASGKIYRVTGIAEDITERKEAQAALRKAYDNMEMILAGLPGSILIVDDQQRVVYTNPLADQQFGAGQPLQERTIDQVLPLTRQCWQQKVVEHRGRREQGQKSEGELESPNKRMYQYRLFPIRIAEGGQQQTGIVIWDVTEQKQLQEQLIQAEKLASLGTLVSGMAHEINNPVQGILAMAEIIAEEPDPEKIKEYAHDIVEYSKHVATVVCSLASYARPASRNEEAPIDLRQRLLEAVKMVRRCPNFGDVEILTRFDPIPRVKARQAEVDQVFVNLISNAVQAMDGKGRLTLATSESRDAVTASVSDTGSGIPRSVMGKIFDPFFTTKDPGKGTGLGLSIAYKIVSKYGGTIHVESEEGKGSRFTIQFPVAHA